MLSPPCAEVRHLYAYTFVMHIAVVLITLPAVLFAWRQPLQWCQGIVQNKQIESAGGTSTPQIRQLSQARNLAKLFIIMSTVLPFSPARSFGAENKDVTAVATVSSKSDLLRSKIPYNHVNMEASKFMGPKATIVFNMKLDDPQTKFQFPGMVELYGKYKDQGLNVLAFPTDQGYFEPDDDETCRAKAKEYLGFGDFPRAVVFDKIDLLGSSAHPFYAALTAKLPTPNWNTEITLNYEKFLLDSQGVPVRRYPRKMLPSEMEADLQAVINNQPLPSPTAAYLKAWREAGKEVDKSEYAFRYNYNYYNSPNSIYKYNPERDER